MLLLGPAVVLSSFLLFLIQPLAGKQMLPLFGGSAAVWSACLLFFQTALLAAYLYAHALTRLLRPRTQALAHAGVVLAALALPQGELKAWGAQAGVLAALVASVGARYFLLASTSPLLQHWFGLLRPEGKPYRLSAWSNAACAAALVSFPFLWEPRFGLAEMKRWWNAGFAAECVLLLGSSALLWRVQPAQQEVGLVAGTPWKVRLRWLLWPALGSAFLMSTSTHLCQVVAPAPLMWIVPLLMYLFSFVVVFGREWYRRQWGCWLALGGMLLMAASMVYLDYQAALLWKVALYGLGLGFVCVFCHGELALLRPAPGGLTSYWTHVAAGGAAGSLAAGWGAAAVLEGYFELPLVVAGCAALCLWLLRRLGRFALRGAAVASILAMTPAMAVISGHFAGLVAAGRNFYGSLRVVEANGLRKMLNGLVVHGGEYRSGELAGQPTAYYSRESAVGLLLAREGGARRVAVVGLGAGTLAAYGRTGDVFRFYEINPLVVTMARRDFGYLGRSAARIEIVEGDARLRLAEEAP
ncbi:MAG: hypothetical protein HZB13_06800, partial [Acidobacteria bacterium]|nr:hypothetical protein [Acidobacteriota bacterium]